MRLTARIKPGSFVHRRWANGGRKGGILHGARFALRGGVFVADAPPDDSLPLLQRHSAVVVEVAATPLESPVAPNPPRIVAGAADTGAPEGSEPRQVQSRQRRRKQE